MVTSEFRDLVNSYCDPQGEVYVEGVEQNPVLARGLERFTEDTLYLYSDDVSLTCSTSSRNHNLLDTAVFGQKMCRVFNVWVDGNLLPRVETPEMMARIDSGYDAQATGMPGWWWLDGPKELVFDKVPASAYSNSRVAGNYLHPDLADDNATIYIESRDLEVAAVECAILLLRPRATGALLNNLKDMKSWLDEEKRNITNRSRRMNDPVPTRARRRRVHCLG